MNDGPIGVVTGAGSGINREIARRLGRRMAVAVCDLDLDSARETVDLIVGSGGSATAWQVDVADRDGVRAMIDQVVVRHRRVDVLVNGAGFAEFVDFLDLTEAQWDRMMDVHAKGTFNATQAVLPVMKDRGYGRIVCISSVGGLSGSPAHSHYAAAKGAVHAFAKALCKEIGPYGVTINVVAAGAIDTPMLGEASPASRERYASNPMGRIGQPTDIAHAVDYFTSDEAGFVTGWVLSVNGGMYT